MMPIVLGAALLDLCVAMCAAEPPFVATHQPVQSALVAAAADDPAPAPIEPARPLVLSVLYNSLAGLQAFDGYSTMHAVGKGAREANPVVQQLVDSPAAFWAVKAATTAAPIMIAEHLWPTHRRAAIAVMIVTNGILAVAAVHNAAVLRQQR